MLPLEMAARKGRQVILHPLFIAAYPVFFLYHANSEAFDFSVVVTPLATSLVLTLLLWWGISHLTRDKKRSAIYTSVLVLGTYSFGPLHEFIGNFSFAQGLEAVSLGTRLVISSFAIVLVSAVLCFKLNHCCPVKSRIESIGWGHRGISFGSRMAGVPVKRAFFRIA